MPSNVLQYLHRLTNLQALRCVLACLSCYNKTSHPGWLINWNLLLTVPEAGKSKDQGTGIGHILVQGPLWFAAGTFWLCPHVDLSCVRPFMRALIPLMRTPLSWPNHPQKPHLLIPSPLGVRILRYEFSGGHRHSDHSKVDNITPPFERRRNWGTVKLRNWLRVTESGRFFFRIELAALDVLLVEAGDV